MFEKFKARKAERRAKKEAAKEEAEWKREVQHQRCRDIWTAYFYDANRDLIGTASTSGTWEYTNIGTYVVTGENRLRKEIRKGTVSLDAENRADYLGDGTVILNVDRALFTKIKKKELK